MNLTDETICYNESRDFMLDSPLHPTMGSDM